MAKKLMTFEDMGDPIKDERGLLCDPHQLRVVIHFLLVETMGMLADEGIARMMGEMRFQMVAPMLHALVCEDVAPGGPEDPKKTETPAPDTTEFGGNDVWSLFGKTSD